MADFKGVPHQVFTDADKLFDECKFNELIELLKQQEHWENNEQILWRLARCEFQLSKADEARKKEFVNLAYEHVKKSLELDDKNGLAHKWAAILLDAFSALQGTKERVLQVLNVRNHMEKAIEYAPNDATSYYLLGEWHYSCYQVSWWERKIASIAFGKLPEADIEEALRLFEKAEDIQKDFYSKNKLMMAKTLLELKRDKLRAKELLEEVVSKYSNSEKWADKELTNLNMGDFKGVPQQVFADADKLFEESKFDEIVKLLKQQKDWENNEQILWRLAKYEFYMSVTDVDQKEDLRAIAYEHVKKSLELDDENGSAHKLAAEILFIAPKAGGAKESFRVMRDVRKHLEKSIQYIPDDPSIYFFLGKWHYSLALNFKFSWLERVIARTKFGKLPEGDLEEALRLFEKAEEVCKDFDPKNKLMLAKTLLELKREKPRAKELLEGVVSKYSNSEKQADKETFMEAYAYSAKLEQFV